MKLFDNVAVIPARGGSTSIPKKNIQLFAGQPLISWTIQQALEAQHITRVIVSTDCEEIAKVATDFGAEVPFLRPKSISKASTPIEPVLSHALQHIENKMEINPQSLVLLFPTNPLRKVSHIDQCVSTFASKNIDCVFTANESPAHYTPYWTMVRREDGRVTYFDGTALSHGYTQRQQFPNMCFAKNDLVFVFKPANLKSPSPSLFGEASELIVVDRIFDGDINEPSDWGLVEDRFIKLNGLYV